jgi:hypothetical protein
MDAPAQLLDRIVRLHHSVIFSLEPTNVKAVAINYSDDLGACFVRTLVRHADHIFRHDLDVRYSLSICFSCD